MLADGGLVKLDLIRMVRRVQGVTLVTRLATRWNVPVTAVVVWTGLRVDPAIH